MCSIQVYRTRHKCVIRVADDVKLWTTYAICIYGPTQYPT